MDGHSVIAVHGLAADPIKTWVDKKEKWNWLENQLVDIIPGACVWTFGYESSWVGDRSPDGELLNDPVTPVDTRLTDVAKCLLDAIKEKVLNATKSRSLEAYLTFESIIGLFTIHASHFRGPQLWRYCRSKGSL